MADWLDITPRAFNRGATPAAPALFGKDEAAGRIDAPLFDLTGEPVADAVADVVAEAVAPTPPAAPAAKPTTPKVRKPMDVQIETGDKVAATVPYSDQWRGAARALKGKFKAGRWEFDARDAERVRALAREVFGTDGNPGDGADLVDVQIKVVDYQNGPVALFAGRTVVERPGRDEACRLGRGVVVVAGDLGTYGGSVKNPRIEAAENVVVEIRDFPRACLSIVSLPYTVVGATIDVEALKVERAALLERLAVIDGMLNP